MAGSRVGGIAANVTFSNAGAVRAAPRLLNGNIYFIDPAAWVPGGALTVTGVAVYDRLSILHEGDGAGEVGVVDGVIRYGGVAIGTVTGGEGTTLTVTFNGDASADAVTAVAGRLAYQLGSNGIATPHSIQLSFTDGNGASVGTANQYEQISGVTTPATPFANLLNHYARQPTIADLNGDGILDFVVSGSVDLDWRLYDTSDPAFVAWVSDLAGPVYRVDDQGRLYVRDFDNPLPALKVYLSDGQGGYTLGVLDGIPTKNLHVSAALVDLNGDGHLDLYTAGPVDMWNDHRVAGYSINDGTGNFRGWTQTNAIITYQNQIYGPATPIAAGDTDGDGQVNLFITVPGTITGGSGESIYLLSAFGYDNRNYLGTPYLADFDGDGDLDAIVKHSWRELVYLENVGGAFHARIGGANPFDGLILPENDYAFVDLDGDGDLDIYVVGAAQADESAPSAHVVWNNSRYGAKSNSTDGSIGLHFTFPQTVTADAYAVDEDGVLTANGLTGVLANDIIPGTLSAVLESGPAHGSLTLNADGSFTYTPTANYNGADSFTYRVNDGTNLSAPVTVALTVNAVADPVVVNADSAATGAAGSVVIEPLANDSNNDGVTLFVSAINGTAIVQGAGIAITLPSGATLTPVADGRFEYRPGNAYDYLVSSAIGATSGLPSVATDRLTYTTNTGQTATVSVTVTGVDGPGDAIASRVGGIASGVTFDDPDAVQGAPQLLNGTIYFIDKSNWAPGGTLSVTGVEAHDRLSILHQGDGAGQVGVAGDTIRYGGVVVGTVTGGNGTALTVTFNNAASADAVTAVAGRLAYQLGAGGEAADHSLRLAFTDGHGVAADFANQWQPIAGHAYPDNPFVGMPTPSLFRPTLGDVNGDGHIDLVLSGNTSEIWYIVEDTPEYRAMVNDWAHPIYGISDDGRLMIRNLLEGDAALKLYLGDGAGNFTRSDTLASGFVANDVWSYLADADGDGDLDLFYSKPPLVAGLAHSTIFYSINDGDANFSGEYVAGVYAIDDPWWVQYHTWFAIGDLNGDGLLDQAVFSGLGNLLQFGGQPIPDADPGYGYLFTPNPYNDENGIPRFLDADGDGDLDLLLNHAGLHGIDYFENDGAGNLTQRIGAANPFDSISTYNSEIAFGDIDGDGDLDMLRVGEGGVTSIVWNNSSYGARPNSTNGSIQLNFDFPPPPNVAPVLDLQLGAVIEADEASFRAIAPDAVVTDADSADFANGTLTVTFVEGASADEGVFIGAQIGVTAIGGTVLYNGLLIGSYTGGDDQQPLVVTFTLLATPDAVQQVVRSLVYYNNSFDIAENRDISVVLTDGDGASSATSVVTVHIEAVDTPVMPEDDYVSTPENAPVVIDVRANDIDPDGGPAETIGAIDGVAIAVGQTVTIESGARVTLNADGTLTYNPNGRFNWLVSEASALLAGAFNGYGGDWFTYTLSGGAEVSVEVEIVGVDGPGDRLHGFLGNDILTGLSGVANFFDVSQGGDDTVTGGGMSNAYYFGATLNGADRITGGAGFDEVGLRGDYSGANALVLGSTTLRNVETIGLLASSGNSYDIATHNDNVAAGSKLTVFGTNLAVGSNFTFDGSAETDGSFRLYGGAGTDDLTGGAGNDGFWFGPDRFDPTVDRVRGGGGTGDQLALDGDYTLTLDGTSIQGIEAITLQRGPVGDSNSFNITLDDSLVADNGRLTIWGYPLLTSLTVDGSAEVGGDLRIYGGAVGDTLTGGGGDDWLWGGYGGDRLTGGAGADVFAYDSVSQSTGLDYDTLVGFDAAVDRIDLPFSVSSMAAAVSGSLSLATFNQDLAAAVGAARLGSGQAVLFTATGGDMNGQTFLIVNGTNSAPGYQAASDYVFHLESTVGTILTPDPFV